MGSIVGHRDEVAITPLQRPAREYLSGTILLERARTLQNFFTQPFFCAEPCTKRPGSAVSIADALDGCAEILHECHLWHFISTAA
jgi:hypothetical protein